MDRVICLFTTIIEPRVSETDGAGHINNTTVPIWFEAGRNKIFQLFTPEMTFENWKMVIVNMNVSYVHQLYYGYEAKVLTWIKRLGNSSFEVYEEIHQNNTICAKGTATYVNFNFQKQKSETIPEDIRNQLKLHFLHDDQQKNT